MKVFFVSGVRPDLGVPDPRLESTASFVTKGTAYIPDPEMSIFLMMKGERKEYRVSKYRIWDQHTDMLLVYVFAEESHNFLVDRERRKYIAYMNEAPEWYKLPVVRNNNYEESTLFDLVGEAFTEEEDTSGLS